MNSFRFYKKARLKSRTLINRLFQKRESVGAYPLRLFWLSVDPALNKSTLQVGFSVPKRKFKKAVTRNRIKRLIREAYRHQQTNLQELLTENGKAIVAMWVYVGNEEMPLSEIQKAMTKVINRFPKNID